MCIMKIAVASDHAGFEYKEEIKRHLERAGHVVVDFGADSNEPVDYPDTIRPAALAVSKGECERGIILGGSGQGEAMVANRIKGIRCALCWNIESARLSREHNDANILSLGQRMMDLQSAIAILDEWLRMPFAGGRHVKRIQKIDQVG